MKAAPPASVVWHDVECGGYPADLPLWRRLAAEAGGPVLDVGAGSGRVALELARAGHRVTALDLDPDLLDVLARRAADSGVVVETVVADAACFDLPERRFSLVIVPMQTVQLLPGAIARAGFLVCARRHLRPGGRLAVALAEDVEAFEPDGCLLPDADEAERDGWRYRSQPVAVRHHGEVMRLERVREAVAPDGTRRIEHDAVDLARLSAGRLTGEAVAANLAAEPSLSIPATDRHVGSEVVMLRA